MNLPSTSTIKQIFGIVASGFAITLILDYLKQELHLEPFVGAIIGVSILVLVAYLGLKGSS